MFASCRLSHPVNHTLHNAAAAAAQVEERLEVAEGTTTRAGDAQTSAGRAA